MVNINLDIDVYRKRAKINLDNPIIFKFIEDSEGYQMSSDYPHPGRMSLLLVFLFIYVIKTFSILIEVFMLVIEVNH